MYHVALASGLMENLAQFTCLPELIVPLQLKGLSKGAGKYALLFKLNFPLSLKLAIQEKPFQAFHENENKNIIQDLLICQGLFLAYFFNWYLLFHGSLQTK